MGLREAPALSGQTRRQCPFNHFEFRELIDAREDLKQQRGFLKIEIQGECYYLCYEYSAINGDSPSPRLTLKIEIQHGGAIVFEAQLYISNEQAETRVAKTPAARKGIHVQKLEDFEVTFHQKFFNFLQALADRWYRSIDHTLTCDEREMPKALWEATFRELLINNGYSRIQEGQWCKIYTPRH